MSKDAGLRIRIEKALRDRFLQTCRAQDLPAAQVLREFMRRYIADHQIANDTQTVRELDNSKRTKEAR
jgi:antitoxin component of RelBE/YafQ-DinJ toxin-antitoxin module